jgi:hypothetical protein
VDGPHRHDEAQSIGGGNVSATPSPRQVDAVLGGDEPGVGLGQGFGPQIVLPDPTQARSSERRHVRSHQRLQAGVARLGQQDGAQRRLQVPRPSIRFAGVRERAGKSGSSIDLQQQFRQIDARQARRDGVPQGDQAGRFFEAVQTGEHQILIDAVPLDADVGVFGQVAGDRLERLVEPLGEPADLLIRALGFSQRAAHGRPRPLPGGAVE